MVLICFSRSCFCLNQLVDRPEKTIHKMKSSFHPEYRYIFCPPSRRSRQITVRALEIVYSFCSFILNTECSYVCCYAFFWLFSWQHSPDFSFSLVCILQHFVSSIDMFHIPLSHLQWLLLNHNDTSDTDIYLAYQNGLPQNSGINNCSVYIYFQP